MIRFTLTKSAMSSICQEYVDFTFCILSRLKQPVENYISLPT